MEQSIVYETLKTMYDYLPRLTDGIIKTVNYFKQQNEDEGLKLLPYIIEGLEWVFEVAFMTKYVFEGYGVHIDDKRIKELSKELLTSIENEDYILASDLFEYEIVEMLIKWQQTLKEMDRVVN